MTSYGVIFKRFDRDLISCEDSTSETSLHVHRSARVVALYVEALEDADSPPLDLKKKPEENE